MKDHMEKETEELSELLMEWYNKGFSDCQEAAMKAAEKAIDMAILLENEACAKLCDARGNLHGGLFGSWAQDIAERIRARSNK